MEKSEYRDSCGVLYDDMKGNLFAASVVNRVASTELLPSAEATSRKCPVV